MSAPVPSPNHAHHWRIATPEGAISRGVCQVCGAEREFRNWNGDTWIEPGRRIGIADIQETRWTTRGDWVR